MVAENTRFPYNSLMIFNPGVQLRTPESVQKYRAHIEQNAGSTACALCEKTALQSFTHWKIVDNDFPYDQIAKVHHMVVPRRHITEQELTTEELKELVDIKHGHVNETYDWIIEATHRNKSIQGHFHLHLIIGKPTEGSA